MSKRIILLIWITIISTNVFSQEEIQKAKEQVAKTEAILESTKDKKETSLSELNDIEAQIEGRAHFLGQIKTRIKKAQSEAIAASNSIDSLQLKISILKEEYAELVYAVYKTGGDLQQLAYVFSSDNFSQFVRRANYLEHYKDVRKKQILEIERSQELLASKKIELEARNKEESALLVEENTQLKALQKLENRQEQVVTDLRKKEVELAQKLKLERKALIELQRQMLALTSSVKKNKNDDFNEIKEPSSNKKPEINSKNISVSFSETRGKLIWPVKDAVIANHFGVRPHPVLSGVTIENHGIDLRVYENAEVKSVFDGVVTAVTKVPNLQNVVMLRHGDYFTVYSKLETVKVNVGDVISKNKVIGKAGKNIDGFFEIQFQIWNMNGEKLDPEQWLTLK
ncbi:murein hydrolase activator EnvC family protein [Flammeovirga kamogawensis]|uniref:Peptidoglycan DD-metalloendopeptidase family protein n=1 Tax=Flammeovirga kamogawensis TaxID=373891 RepID=A0ABX8GRA3_9BACT|nr:peptidoglycan DD-metalloendopeptidase family protein [Flammeovirga kamogawensis]MBB6463203.1 septal ring factor EnvC (AmiA/AmiB activator) [Flammeovirga kamogawensis]QWG05944.1 peptidoglycan DD-metalloendopeptidase family protein [Flammeovirga kamogawensis]TRX67770.1 peptidoglycan DD-metalloendopeptidase family protein [Flammeovirga kamogawensis]